MSDYLDRWNAQEAHAKLADLAKRSQQIGRELQQALDYARGYTDPKLSAEGLAEKRAELAAKAQLAATQQVNNLRVEHQQASAAITAWAGSKRPRIADDAVQLQKLSLAWDRARALLDSGRSVGQVLESATDPTMVLAIREWAPDYLRASTPRQEGLVGLREEADYSALARSADDRLAQLHGGDVATAVTMLRDLEVAGAGINSRTHHAELRVAGAPHDPLQAVLAGHYAEQFAGATYQDASDAGDAA